MVVQVFQDQLMEVFPERTWTPLTSAIRDGVRLADRVIVDTPMLASVIGQDLRGHIRRAGILHSLWEACQAGSLPFKAERAKMPIGCWHWLDIRSGEMVAHIVRTDDPSEIPKMTSNRQPKFMKNSFDLFEDGRIPPLDLELMLLQERYCTVTFGANHAGDLTHARIGTPSKDGLEWLATVDLLRYGKPEAESSVPPAPTPPDPAQLVKFLKRIQDTLEQEKKPDEKSA